ncbi:MAG: VOC family protein [Reichenbachiella sp.]|uniref:VOC family protein n=1 Tax=Reichenbachiella sp. TaxID=2184521 RepID=UPI002967327D|nr:VOC family protein [Reichenbachiella sp.]MDW3210386.1 VOC family protein [Reichenbachiella sp.]
MRILIYIWLIFVLSMSSQAQNTPPNDLTPYFNAIIVSNMDSSLVWYQQTLGYEVLNSKQFPEMGFKQANLKKGNASLELIELNSAIDPKELILNYDSKTKVLGLFKLGFQVDDFDLWIAFLKLKQVSFNGGVVKDETTGKRIVIILDPDSNRIQLFER